MRIGVVGLGLMGVPIAARLVAAGHDVAVTSRRRPAEYPGDWVDGVPELGGRDLVITMLPGGPDVLGVVEQLQESPPTVIVDMSTIGPEWARRVSALLGDDGFVDAPVSGGPAGAATGTLAIMAGGTEAALATARGALEALGSVHHLGPVGAGQSAKLVNQVLLAGIMSGIADGFALAEAAGLDPVAVHAAVGGGMAGGRLLDFAWPRIAGGDDAPGFKISHFVKDLDLALADGETSGADLPLTARVRDAYATLLPGHASDGTQALIHYDRQPSPGDDHRSTR